MLHTVRYGSGNVITREFPAGTTLGQILANARPALGFGENVEGHVGGVPQQATLVPNSSMDISVHDKACEKRS